MMKVVLSSGGCASSLLSCERHATLYFEVYVPGNRGIQAIWDCCVELDCL